MMMETDSNGDSDGNCEDAVGKVFRILWNTSPRRKSRRIKCTFRLIPGESEIRSVLADVIYNNGGDILPDDASISEHAVTILNEKHFVDNPEERCALPLDTFSSMFIYDAVRVKQEKRSLPNLNRYRLTSSKFEEYDANKILFQEIKWSDLKTRQGQTTASTGVTAQTVISCWKNGYKPPAPAPPQSLKAPTKPPNLVFRAHAGPSRAGVTCSPAKRVKVVNPTPKTPKPVSPTPAPPSPAKDLADESLFSSDVLVFSGSESEGDDEPSEPTRISTVSSNSSKAPGRRIPFSTAEGQRILNLICENNAFMFTKGMKLWELMADSKRLPGRTSQSLKEHFRKKVLPNVLKSKIYKISPGHLKQLQKAQERSAWKRHANFCPDYDF